MIAVISRLTLRLAVHDNDFHNTLVASRTQKVFSLPAHKDIANPRAA
jgi:hypothetical protein